jgi:dual oxidase maturation factor 1
MAFEAFRSHGAPTFYQAEHIPWEGDILTSGLIFCFVILVFSFYIILPGLVGKEKAFSFVRVTVSMFIGAVILVSNFAMSWETATVQTVTKFRAGTGHNVNVTIRVHIGFRGLNITLKGQKDQIEGETIDYNENFNWEGVQGRQGFGPSAGQFNRQFRAAQLRGVPLPILAVAEYFTIDGEGIRWGRFYRQAGWYSHIALWLAFPLWILSNILFFTLLRYGAYFLAMSGLSMVTSNIIWATMRNPTELKIQFTTKDILVFSYGAAFWFCLITGIVCIILGVAIFFLDKLFPAQAAVFFSVDILQDSEAIIVEEEPPTPARSSVPNVSQDAVDASSSIPVIQVSATEDDDDDDDDDPEGFYKVPPPPVLKVSLAPDPASPFVVRHLPQRRSTRTMEHPLTNMLQRPRRREPPPRPQPVAEEGINGGHQRASANLSEPGGAGHRVTFSSKVNQEPVAMFENVGATNVTMTGYEKTSSGTAKQ